MAAAQVLIYVGAVNVLILFAIMLVNKREDFKVLPNAWFRKVATGLVCIGLFAISIVLRGFTLMIDFLYSSSTVHDHDDDDDGDDDTTMIAHSAAVNSSEMSFSVFQKRP